MAGAQVRRAMIYPLLLLGALALIIIVDRAVVYRGILRLPRNLLDLVETYEFSWSELDAALLKLSAGNAYRRFFGVIAANRTRPAWWVESHAGDEAGNID